METVIVVEMKYGCHARKQLCLEAKQSLQQ